MRGACGLSGGVGEVDKGEREEIVGSLVGLNVGAENAIIVGFGFWWEFWLGFCWNFGIFFWWRWRV